MESKLISKRFISQNFDKFLNKTETKWIDPESRKTIGAKWGLNWENTIGYGEDKSSQIFNLKLRHIKTPTIDSLVIDFHFFANDWFFLRDGKIIINCNSIENIELKPHDSNTSVGKYGGSRIEEIGFYNISKEQLKRICDANTIAVKVSGANNFFELEGKGLLKFHFMCRSFYSELFEDSSYNQWINSIVSPMSNKRVGGCFIATATMGDYNHPVVVDLRLFRDDWLLKRSWGIHFTNWYYKHSPKVANIIANSLIIRKITFLIIVKPLQIFTKILK